MQYVAFEPIAFHFVDQFGMKKLDGSQNYNAGHDDVVRNRHYDVERLCHSEQQIYTHVRAPTFANTHIHCEESAI